MSKPIKASDGMKLNRSERKRFADLEGRIDKGKKAFLEVGRALAEIHSSKLYRERDSTFEAYCQRRHNFTPQRAAQLMDAVEVVESISGHTSTMVEVGNERQARELVNTPAEKRAETWAEAVAAAPQDSTGKPKVTAAVVRQAASAVAKPDAQPWDEYNADLDAAISSLRSARSSLNKAFKVKDGDITEPMAKDAHFSRIGTTSQISELIRNLANGKIVGRDKGGFITTKEDQKNKSLRESA